MKRLQGRGLTFIPPDLPYAGSVVVVCVADKNDWGVTILEVQMVDAGPNQRDI